MLKALVSNDDEPAPGTREAAVAEGGDGARERRRLTTSDRSRGGGAGRGERAQEQRGAV